MCNSLTELVHHLIKVVTLVLILKELADLAGDNLGNVIDVLRLDDGLQVILENLGEVVLEFGTTEVLQNILPVGRVVELAEVGLQLAGQDLQGCGLADTVGTDQTQDLARTGHGQTMQLE